MYPRRSDLLLAMSLTLGCGQSSGTDATRVASATSREVAPTQSAGVPAQSGDTPEPGSYAEGAEPFTCPAPETANEANWSCFPTEYWGRAPVTGECCRYGALCEVPPDWAAFTSEAECQSDCRCHTVEPARFVEPGFSPGIAYESFECGGGGSETAAQKMRELCEADRGPIYLAIGCERVMISTEPNLSVTSWVFDAATGRQIGLLQAGDTLSLPCRTSVTVSGTPFDCSDAPRCVFCNEDDAYGDPVCDAQQRASVR